MTPPPESPGAVLARHGRSFYFASRFLGPQVAADCARLYAFCRMLDDLADEAPDPGAAALALQAVADDLAAGQSADPEVAAFLALADRHGLDLAAARALIDGLILDCQPVRIADQEALVRYAYRVAGTVGVLMSPILGVRQPAAYAHAIDLGIAMQLTNIARDVLQDAGMDRRYLPGDWIGDLPPSALLHPTIEIRQRVAQALGRLLDLADRYYRSGRQGYGYLPPRSRLAIAIAGACYRAIGDALRRRRLAWWQGRVSVGLAGKCRVTACEAIPVALVARTAGRHDAALHQPLHGLFHGAA